MTRLTICLFCAAVASWQFLSVALPACPDCLQVTEQIAAGTANGPFVYRVLTPGILAALGNTTGTHVLFHFVGLLAFFLLLWAWAERWNGNGMASVALVAVALPTMYPTFYFSQYAIVELVLCLSGLLLLTGRWSSSAPSTGK